MLDKKKIRSAAIWSTIEAFSNILLSLISIVFLARLLQPEDYGNIATAQIIASLLALTLSFGLSEAVIQKKTIDDTLKSTVLLGSIFLSLFAVIIAAVLIFFLHVFLENKVVSKILIFETAGTVFTLLSILPTAILLRNLKMSSFTKRTLLSRVIFFCIAIPCALNGFGIWSVVYANFIQALTAFVFIFYAIRSEIPKKIRFDFSVFKELITFGFYVMVENILWNVITRVFSILIAAYHGVYALGLYNISTRITDAALNVLNTVVGRMALPLFSQVQDDKDKLLDIFSKATFIFNIISMPLFFVIALTSPHWVPMILGEKWNEAVPIIQIIAVMNAIMFSRIFVGTAMKAVGESKRFMYLSLVSAFLAVAIVFITRETNLIYTMISWTTVRIVVTISFGVFLMTRILRIGVWQQFSPLFFPVIISVVMSLLFFVISSILSYFSLNRIVVLIVESFSLLLAYSASLYLLKRKGFLKEFL